jgi:hypothetical protein
MYEIGTALLVFVLLLTGTAGGVLVRPLRGGPVRSDSFFDF